MEFGPSPNSKLKGASLLATMTAFGRKHEEIPKKPEDFHRKN